jgi:hypothetical protein
VSFPLDDDLARWEAGDLSLDDLRRRHPGEDVDALLALHGRLLALAEEPTPDAAAAWAVAMPTVFGPPAAPRRRRRSRRAVVAASIAAFLAVPTVSYAAAPEAVRSVVREVRDLLPGLPDTDDDGPTGGGTDARAGTPRGATTTTTTAPAVSPVPAAPGGPAEPTDDRSDDDRSGISGDDATGAQPDSDADDGTETDLPAVQVDDVPAAEADDPVEEDGEPTATTAPDEDRDSIGEPASAEVDAQDD